MGLTNCKAYCIPRVQRRHCEQTRVTCRFVSGPYHTQWEGNARAPVLVATMARRVAEKRTYHQRRVRRRNALARLLWNLSFLCFCACSLVAICFFDVATVVVCSRLFQGGEPAFFAFWLFSCLVLLTFFFYTLPIF